MVRSIVLATATLLILALQTPSGTAPDPTPTPKTIIRIKTSPFCDAFRDNVFHAVEGLRVNDRVIDEGRSLLAKLAYDDVADSTGMDPVPGVPSIVAQSSAPSVQMDQFELEQIVGQAAHNLQRIYGLLNDAKRFAKHPQNDADRDLASMKSALVAVADAQERSLNLLSGEYNTAELNDLFSRGDNTAGVLGQVSVSDKRLALGDPILTSPGSMQLPAGGPQGGGSLFASTSFGHVATAITISQSLTGSAENHVLSAVLAGVDRCRAF